MWFYWKCCGYKWINVKLVVFVGVLFFINIRFLICCWMIVNFKRENREECVKDRGGFGYRVN